MEWNLLGGPHPASISRNVSKVCDEQSLTEAVFVLQSHAPATFLAPISSIGHVIAVDAQVHAVVVDFR